MKIYKDLNNNVHEIEVGFEKLLPNGSVEITQAEADTLLAPPQPTKQEIIKSISDALQNALDTEAQKLGYDNILTAVSYADEPAVPSFQADGQSFRARRSNVWAYAYGVLAQFDADTAQYITDKTQYDVDYAQWLIDAVADPSLVEPIEPTPPVQPTEQSMIANMPTRV